LAFESFSDRMKSCRFAVLSPNETHVSLIDQSENDLKIRVQRLYSDDCDGIEIRECSQIILHTYEFVSR
jgi:hypothetical protein